MLPDDNEDKQYTYNELSNEDKDMIKSHGLVPGELEPEDEQELLRQWREEIGSNDPNSESEGTIADEQDGTDSV